MADVIAISLFIGYCCCQLCWLMLLPLCFILADVIANYVMADVIAIMFNYWLMLLPIVLCGI